jgi:hypothetical protein
MECDYHAADRLHDPLVSDLALAQHARVCVLISAPRERAWDTAREIAGGCGSGLSRIDCDAADEHEIAGLLREHVGNGSRAGNGIVFLREVQVLSPSNQRLLDELIGSHRDAADRPRLIASSSLSLYERTQAGLFEDALFYKLNAVHLKL